MTTKKKFHFIFSSARLNVCSTQGFTVRAACLTYNHNIIPFSYLNRLAECPARLHCHTQELLSVSKFYVPISVSYLSFLFFYQDFIYLLCPFIWFPVKYFYLDNVLCFSCYVLILIVLSVFLSTFYIHFLSSNCCLSLLRLFIPFLIRLFVLWRLNDVVCNWKSPSMKS